MWESDDWNLNKNKTSAWSCEPNGYERIFNTIKRLITKLLGTSTTTIAKLIKEQLFPDKRNIDWYAIKTKFRTS